MCVRSILDTDLYKFATSYAYMKLYPEADNEYRIEDLCIAWSKWLKKYAEI